MADGTRLMELRKEVETLKDQFQTSLTNQARAEQTIEEMKLMMDSIFNSFQNSQASHSGATPPPPGFAPENPPPPPPPTHHSPSKYACMDFPHFSVDDLRTWIYRADQFFEVDDTPPQDKVKIAAVHFDGKALQWHQSCMKNRLTGEISSREDYVRALYARFGSQLFDDPMLELVSLRKTSTMTHYLERFDELVNSVDLPDHHFLSCFMAGLKNTL